jgi:hypothetical protein
MTPEERSLLERIAALTEENNKLLKSMQKSARWRTAFQIFYWVLIIALTFGAFYFIQPYINSLTGALGEVNSNGTSTGQSQSFSQELQNALKQYQ